MNGTEDQNQNTHYSDAMDFLREKFDPEAEHRPIHLTMKELASLIFEFDSKQRKQFLKALDDFDN
jgi:hypothetical protein